MNNMSKLLIAGLVILYTGCSTSINSIYSPTSPPIYTEPFHGSVSISSITDKRNMEPTAYYKSFQRWDKANYNRSVSDIVREALGIELGRAGLKVQKPANAGTAANGIMLKAEVLQYLANVSRPFGLFVSDVLDLKVSVRFSWLDSTGKLLEENERSEYVTRNLGINKGPVMPLGSTEIDGYGAELMNSILPRVIEKEIRLNKVLK